ncbi:H-NS family nucleoid-associated regulatory protein [Tateyamaria sp.]|uniref:H-NS histone family protein n=1 Tax=Tateyamaria sp. TaxID=1929288 RepID=UPI003B219FCD
MAIDLSKMSRKELETPRADVEKTLTNLHIKEKQDALAAVQKAAAEFGFSLEELTSKRGAGRAASKGTSAPNYANPDDASQTWTGKGRQPNWFKSAVSAGKSPEDMEI